MISIPSWDLFDHQDQAYRDQVLPPEITARVAVEQAAVLGWAQYVGPEGSRDRHEKFWGFRAAERNCRKILASRPKPLRKRRVNCSGSNTFLMRGNYSFCLAQSGDLQ